MNPKIIAIVSAPGVGKTYLSKKLSKKLNATLIKEPKINKRILTNLKEQKRSFETIIYFLNKGIKNIEQAHKLKKEKKIIIMDTYWLSTILHIETMLTGFEKKIIKEQTKLLQKYFLKPDITIYLKTSELQIKQNIKERNRNYDTNQKYLNRIYSIKNEHEKYFKINSEHITINKQILDFSKEKDLNIIITKINK